MSLVSIPSTFGTGGSGLNPTSHPTANLQNILTQLTAAVAQLQNQDGQGNPEEIAASGALSTGVLTSRVTISGTKAYTLIDGTTPGERKRIYIVAAASTPSGVLTPAHASGFTTITYGTGSATSWHDLEWDASLGTPAWKITGGFTAGTVTVA